MMTVHDKTGTNFIEILNVLLQTAQQLQQLLIEETAALRNADLDALAAVTDSKQVVFTRLQQQQNTFYQSVGYEGEPDSIQDKVKAKINTFAASLREDLNNEWQEIRKVLMNCYRKNAVNGNVVQVNLIQMRNIFNAMTKKPSANLVYCSDGKMG